MNALSQPNHAPGDPDTIIRAHGVSVRPSPADGPDTHVVECANDHRTRSTDRVNQRPRRDHGGVAPVSGGDEPHVSVASAARRHLELGCVLATALTTFTLGSAEVPHYTLLLGLALVFISILLEGRRYRHLHHSKWRLYLLESGFFANMLCPAKKLNPSPDWRRLLAADLRHTHFSISWLTGMRLRLRRNYLLVISFMSAVWVAKLFIHPTRVTNLVDFYARLHVGDFIPSWLVAATALVFLVTAALLGLTCPPAEKLEDWSIHYHRRRVQEINGE